jgi:cysteine desulfurase
VQDLPEGLAVSDWTQAFGKLPMAFDWSGVDMALISAHKIGGPKGIGALILRRGLDVRRGSGRRAGDGAPVGHRKPDRDCRIWGCGRGGRYKILKTASGTRRVELRNILEKTLEPRAKETIFVGQAERGFPTPRASSRRAGRARRR